MEQPRAIAVDEVAAARPEFWSQEEIGEANGSLFRAAKGIGSTEWHAHEDQDEVFLVTHGTLIVELRSGDVIVGKTVTSDAAGGKPTWSVGGGMPDTSES